MSLDCCAPDLDTSQAESDQKIQNKINETEKKRANEIRLLLLGAGESGKSTIAKQLRILHKGSFSTDERKEYIEAVHRNLYESVALIFQASKALEVNIKKKDNRHFAMQYMEPFPGRIPPEHGPLIEAFWKDTGVQVLFARRNEYQLIDSAGYYLAEAMRICDPHFIPNDQDILRTRTQTTGIIETNFVVEGKKFILVDVGGQRSERKKWMHVFENVTGVLFCVGISEYDKFLYEDNRTNRIHEARKLFHEICQSKWFTETAMILFLNKDDIFREKIAAGHNIKVCFEDYAGPVEYEPSIKFLEKKFVDVIDVTTGKPREIYTHVTCATDTTSVKAVFEAVKKFIIQRTFKEMGLN